MPRRLRIEGEQLDATVGAWFCAISLFAAALGTVDRTSGLAADVLKISYLHRAKDGSTDFALVWGQVLIGCVVLIAGLARPLVLLVIPASLGAATMVIYSVLLAVLNRKVLPEQIRILKGRMAALGWAFLLFGVLSVLTIKRPGRPTGRQPN